jgi:prepilin-type N-terminal cleavage/methylation domain-containing protein
MPSRSGLGRAGRAFTIIELMVVLAIMLAVGAIALPLALDDAKRAAMREAQDQLEAVLLSARADAQRTGKTVRVIGVVLDGRWVLTEEEVLERKASDDVSPGSGSDLSGATRVIQELPLPDGVRLGRTRDEAEGKVRQAWEPGSELGESDESDAEMTTDPSDAGASGGQEIQIAVLLPDGQIMATRPLYLGGADGRVGEVSVNGWTGVLTVTLLPARTGEPGEGEESGDEQEGTDIGEGGEGGGQEP